MPVQRSGTGLVWLAVLSVCVSGALACADDDAGRFGPDGSELAENRVEPSPLVLSTHEVTISVNESVRLTAAYEPQDAWVPSDVTAQVQWLSADPSIAWVHPDERGEHAKQGAIVGVYPGTTEITARYAGSSDSVLVTVTTEGLRELEIQSPLLEIPNGTTASLRAIGVFSQGARRDVTRLVTWRSQDTAIADFEGEVLRGHARGNVAITATLGDERGTLELRVTDARLLELEALRQREQMEVSTTQQLRARGRFSDGTSVDVTDLAVWSSDDGNLASVDDNGLVHARSTGEVGIWARYLGMAAQTSVLITASGEADSE